MYPRGFGLVHPGSRALADNCSSLTLLTGAVSKYGSPEITGEIFFVNSVQWDDIGPPKISPTPFTKLIVTNGGVVD